LVANLDNALQLGCLLGELAAQVELTPVAHRLLAIDVLAGADGIQRLRHMETVGRGDADHVHLRVGQQFVVLEIGLGAGGFGGFLQPVAERIVHRHHLDRFAGLDEFLHDAQMAAAPAAYSDKTDTDAVVRPDDSGPGDERKGGDGPRGHGGCGSRAHEFAAVQARGGVRLRNAGLHNRNMRMELFVVNLERADHRFHKSNGLAAFVRNGSITFRPVPADS
jgi:hypothetical protein